MLRLLKAFLVRLRVVVVNIQPFILAWNLHTFDVALTLLIVEMDLLASNLQTGPRKPKSGC